jgi:hypothetical protein
MRCGLCGQGVASAVVLEGLPGDSLVCYPCWQRWQREIWFPAPGRAGGGCGRAVV